MNGKKLNVSQNTAIEMQLYICSPQWKTIEDLVNIFKILDPRIINGKITPPSGWILKVANDLKFKKKQIYKDYILEKVKEGGKVKCIRLVKNVQ